MKNYKNLSRRLLAVLVALLLCVGTLPVAAFAADPEEVDGRPAIPDGVEVNVDTTEDVAPNEDGGNDVHKEVDTNWNYKDEEKSSQGEYDDKTLVSDSNEAKNVDDLKSGDQEALETLPDGTYSKTEAQGKVDVDVQVKGEENYTQDDSYNEDGDRVAASLEVNGTQTTTTTTTNTTKTTTTEVSKESEVKKTGENEGELILDSVKDDTEKEAFEDHRTQSGEENATFGEKQELTNEELRALLDELREDDRISEDEYNDILNGVAKIENINDVLDQKDIKSRPLVVKKNQTVDTDDKTGAVASTLDKEALKEKLLSSLDGWQINCGAGKVGTVKVENGTVTVWVGDQQVALSEITLTETPGDNANKTTYSVDAWKVTTADSKTKSESEVIGNAELDKNGNIVLENGETKLYDGLYTTDGESVADVLKEGGKIDPKNIDWEKSGYREIGREVQEDGSVIVKYERVGTAERNDTATWTEVHTRTDGVVEIKQMATVSAKIDLGSYVVSAEWHDPTDSNENNRDVKFETLTPGTKVIEKGLESRYNTGTMPTDHITIGNYFKVSVPKGATEAQVKAAIEAKAKELAGQLDNEIDLSAGLTLDFYQYGDGSEFGGVFLESTVAIKNFDGTGNSKSAWIRRMKIPNTQSYFYVYCVEHGQPTHEESYDIANTENHYLYGENADNIQYVAENGWWGTDSGVGSLDAVKDFVRKNGSAADKLAVENLDEGLALAATQAALWYFTSDKAENANKKINPNDVFGNYWTDGNGNKEEKPLSGADLNAAMALFNTLIAKNTNGEAAQTAANSLTTTDLLDKNDIESTSITVAKKVEVDSVEALTKKVQAELAAENKTKDSKAVDKNLEWYEADVSVTLAVVPSRLNSKDLTVYVYSDGVLVGSQRVTEDYLRNNNGVVTLEKVTLASGKDVTFNLEGTQELTQGAYLFQTAIEGGSSKSQTMVGYVAGGKQNTTTNVNLEVNVTFRVKENDPTATSSVQNAAATREWEETYEVYENKTGTVKVTENYKEDVVVKTTVTVVETPVSTTEVESVYWTNRDSATFTPDGDDDEPPTPGTPEDPTPNTPVESESSEEANISDEETPLAELSEDTEIPDEETPLAEMPEEELEIPDEEVPLANVPHTGDISSLWSILLLTSAAGLILLMRKKEVED